MRLKNKEIDEYNSSIRKRLWEAANGVPEKVKKIELKDTTN